MLESKFTGKHCKYSEQKLVIRGHTDTVGLLSVIYLNHQVRIEQRSPRARSDFGLTSELRQLKPQTAAIRDQYSPGVYRGWRLPDHQCDLSNCEAGCKHYARTTDFSELRNPQEAEEKQIPTCRRVTNPRQVYWTVSSCQGMAKVMEARQCVSEGIADPYRRRTK